MKQKIFTVTIFLIFLFTFFVYAQKSPETEPVRIRQQIEKFQKEELERLKKVDPAAFERRREQIQRQEAINGIVSSFYEKKISASEAEKKLYPLIREESEDYLKSLDLNIEKLKKRVSQLEKIKKDPNIYIQKRIDRLLGKTASEEFLDLF